MEFKCRFLTLGLCGALEGLDDVCAAACEASCLRSCRPCRCTKTVTFDSREVSLGCFFFLHQETVEWNPLPSVRDKQLLMFLRTCWVEVSFHRFVFTPDLYAAQPHVLTNTPTTLHDRNLVPTVALWCLRRRQPAPV